MRSQFAKFIKEPETLKAYHYLLKLVGKSKLTCEYVWDGKCRNKKTCNFRKDPENVPYAFIVNQKWLTFYFRKCALIQTDPEKTETYRKKLAAELSRDFGDDFKENPNQGMECHVKLKCVDDVDRLVQYLVW